MTPSTQTNNHTVRNLAIFTVVVLASGWLGYALDTAMNNPPTESLGMLLWLIAPLAAALILRAFAGDGWGDFGLGLTFGPGGLWLHISLLIYPVGALFVLVIGALLGLVTFPSFATASLISAIAMGLIPAFVKNIFEEFAWRGYLAPRIHTLHLNDYLGHAVVGLIWGCWHIPYWLFYLGNAQIEAATAQSLPTFIPMAILGLVIASIAYGQIRLLTGSVWPAVLMHTISNALIDIQVVGGFIDIAPGMGILVSPAHQSILSMIFFLMVGVGLHTWRVRRQSVASNR